MCFIFFLPKMAANYDTTLPPKSKKENDTGRKKYAKCVKSQNRKDIERTTPKPSVQPSGNNGCKHYGEQHTQALRERERENREFTI
jgi:hypothetical protein